MLMRMTDHHFFMRRCCELAEQGRGKTGTNPMVGAVLMRDAKIIAEGFHEAFGKVHAERALLESFNDVQPDDILYVNLEPCCHTGKTPPCTDIMLERGIKHIVYGMQDSDTRVSGKGIKLLRSKGVDVIGPVMRASCERLNRGFISLQKNKRPYITLKKGMMLDGRSANIDGARLIITSKEQDIWSHTFLRSQHDAILVGIGTILKDDPILDCRLDSLKRDLHPYRIILDARLQIPLESHVASDEHSNRTIVIHGPVINHEMDVTIKELLSCGVRTIEVPVINNAFEWSVLWQLLLMPVRDYCGMTSILVEGGSKTWDIFKKARMVDEEILLMGN